MNIPNSQDGWNKVEWSKIQLSVYKLQKRIYSATNKTDYKLARTLQNTLIPIKQKCSQPQELLRIIKVRKLLVLMVLNY